jgi:cell division protein FtsQ
MRRRLACLAVALALAGGGFAWLRDSSLVAVRQVTITGAEGRTGPLIASALRGAARGMTTLHVREDDLRRAVRAYPSVEDVRVQRRPLHGLHLTVVLRRAVAAVDLDGQRVPVAADGTLLRGEPVSGELPTLDAGRAPGQRRLTDRTALDTVAVMGAAPPVLRTSVEDVRRDASGLHVEMRSGPRLDFGRPSALRAKWTAAARVLADPRAAGAQYVDVRVPARPSAGPFSAEPIAPAAAAAPASGEASSPTGG